MVSIQQMVHFPYRLLSTTIALGKALLAGRRYYPTPQWFAALLPQASAAQAQADRYKDI